MQYFERIPNKTDAVTALTKGKVEKSSPPAAWTTTTSHSQGSSLSFYIWHNPTQDRFAKVILMKDLFLVLN